MSSPAQAKPPSALFQHPAGWKYHGAALLYALTAVLAGFTGLFSASWVISLPATLFLAHGMTIAAYMIHECGHNTVFKNNANNARLETGHTAPLTREATSHRPSITTLIFVSPADISPN